MRVALLADDLIPIMGHDYRVARASSVVAGVRLMRDNPLIKIVIMEESSIMETIRSQDAPTIREEVTTAEKIAGEIYQAGLAALEEQAEYLEECRVKTETAKDSLHNHH